MKLSIIAAVDKKQGLGKNNQLLCHLPADLKYFKQVTLNKSIIMGYNTFRSIGKALPKRRNIVITSKKDLIEKDVEFVASLEQAIALCQHDEGEVMIIGGAMVYRQAINRVDKIYLTEIQHEFEADVFFPDFQHKQWQKSFSEFHAADEKNKYDFSFNVYTQNISNSDT